MDCETKQVVYEAAMWSDDDVGRLQDHGNVVSPWAQEALTIKVKPIFLL